MIDQKAGLPVEEAAGNENTELLLLCDFESTLRIQNAYRMEHKCEDLTIKAVQKGSRA